MKLPEFERLLVAYGTELGAWPEDRIKAAEDFLQGSPEAAASLRDAAQLESLLHKGLEFPGNANASAARALARASALIDVLDPVEDTGPGSGWPWVRAGGLAAAALALFFLGMGYGSFQSAETGRNATATWIVDGPYRTLASL